MDYKSINDAMSPPDMQDAFSRELVDNPEYGMIGAKKLKDGTYVGLIRLITTIAICIGATERSAYNRRYCYSDLGACLEAYEKLETGESIPDGWIAQRP